jgi:hypothetical protein
MEILARPTMVTTARVEFVLLVELREGAWAVQVVAGEPQPGMIFKCLDSGERFRIKIAGSIDARALVAGRRILSFYPISSGRGDVREGYRMIDDPVANQSDGNDPNRG